MAFNKKMFVVVFVIFLLGCQQQAGKVSEEKPIETGSEQPVIEEIEEELDDNLDAALEELEEIEDI